VLRFILICGPLKFGCTEQAARYFQHGWNNGKNPMLSTAGSTVDWGVLDYPLSAIDADTVVALPLLMPNSIYPKSPSSLLKTKTPAVADFMPSSSSSTPHKPQYGLQLCHGRDTKEETVWSGVTLKLIRLPSAPASAAAATTSAMNLVNPKMLLQPPESESAAGPPIALQSLQEAGDFFEWRIN
jgi:hypothetical protein